eukprot:COSAG01_NODE_7067_length_3368_cov_12.018748_9_plen_65_part_00
MVPSPRRTARGVPLRDTCEDIPTHPLELAVSCEGRVCARPSVEDDEERSSGHQGMGQVCHNAVY